MTLIGYMRVSTDRQDTQLQRDALLAHGIDAGNLYEDVISGKTTSRRGLDACVAALGPGDTLVVWRLDRLGRSLKHLVEMVEGFRERGVGFRSLMDPVDTTSASGEFVFHVFAALAQFERRLASERIKAGIASVRSSGDGQWGRRAVIPAEHIQTALASGKRPQEVAATYGVSLASVYRAGAA